MIKILHTGDTHLGDLNGPTRDGKNLRRLDTLGCMEAIVNRAEIEAPDITIIAGDLFNRARVWADTALEDVTDALERFIRPLCAASGAVVLLFGTENHDNPRAFEVLTQSTGDLKNLRIYTVPGVETIQTKGGPVQILAAPGFDKGRLRLFMPGADKEDENRNATALVNDMVLGLAAQLDPAAPSIMVAHYTVAGAEADNGSTFLAGQDVVILPSTIDAARVNLACFGHIHHPQKLVSQTPAYYCGSPNQLNFNDEGTEHGFWLHTFFDTKEAGIGSQFIRTPERQHYTYRMGPVMVGEFIQTGELKEIPPAMLDAIVRVRYQCTSEQEKAFNRAELQKKILQAGAFHVAEVLPEEIEELGAKDTMTEHDGPAESLARWLEMNEVTATDATRLMELAAPIIRQADDGRQSSKHTGAFTPLWVEVKNYRSYTGAYFDFEPVHMAMVNGPNGVGKSSLFMDAIADCLFEQSRNEDIGGWVRDGTKSGAVTFSFALGGQQYKVIRTRTRSGKGTLALQRFDNDSTAWVDEGDTTMRLTQAKIERLLGMDCNTFCSIALIRQDAYGLFLEADSDRRMEVLSALLGLDIYTRMEDIAKSAATDQRRKIAATKERINILDEQVKEKEALDEDNARLMEKTGEITEALNAVEVAIRTEEQAEAMRNELQTQANEKTAEAGRYDVQITEKKGAADDAARQLETARTISGMEGTCRHAAAVVADARKELDTLAPMEERSRANGEAMKEASLALQRAEDAIQTARRGKDALTGTIAQKGAIEAAQRAIAELTPKKEAAARRMEERRNADADAFKAKQEVDKFLADSRARIAELAAKVEATQQETLKLTESGCINPSSANCKFLVSARAAMENLPGLEKQLKDMKAADRATYENLMAVYKTAKEKAEALGDTGQEYAALAAEEQKHIPLANLASKLADATAKMEWYEQSEAEAQQNATGARAKLSELEGADKELSQAVVRAAELRQVIAKHQFDADTLPQCLAAKAKVEVLAPRLDELKREISGLEDKRQEVMQQAAAIRERITGDSSNLNGLRAIRDTHRRSLTDFAVQQGEIKAKMDRIAEAEEQTAQLRDEVKEIAARLNDYTTLVQAFGLEGIQYMIIRGVVPEIMHRSNDILASMTGGKMAVDIRTEKEQKSTKQIVNSLEVWINTIAGSNRPYLSHSGGEKVKIALAVTLGLADVKARRAGVQLGMLFIDEPPFLDSDGTEAYADALTNMAVRNPGMRILAISHDPGMKARFPQSITVVGGNDGSAVSME